jgi:acyl-coenzyme A thioesterase PaaI-like protein
MRAGTLRRLMNVWPPFLFAGIRVRHLGEDWRDAHVVLHRRPWNRNYVGTQFGGSLFAMADPFWMLLAMHRLGREYYVWDRAGRIDFLKPARGTVHARFHLDDATVDALRQQAAGGQRVLHWLEVDLTDDRGHVVARVGKQLYVRLKPRHRDDHDGDPGMS